MPTIKQLDEAGTKFLASNVRIAYPDLAVPRHFKNDEKTTARYSVTVLIPKSDTESAALLQNAIRKMAKERLKLDRIPAADVCLRDGDESTQSAYAGHWFLSLHRYPSDKVPNNNAPAVVDGSKNRIQPTDSNYPYSGCRANVVFEIYTSPSGKWKKVNGGFSTVQFHAHDEVIGGGNDLGYLEETDPDLA